MKKVILSVLALAAFGGCATYDYYEGGVRYTQDGRDCIYYSGEFGNRFSLSVRELDSSKRIVYRNTRCEDLYARDMMGQAPRQDRQILVPAAQVSYAPVSAPCTSCAAVSTCNTCAHSQPQPISSRKYVIVPAM